MRLRIVFFFVLLSLSVQAQITDTATLRNYINANIVPNGTRSITATQLNTTFNGILNVLPTSTRNIFNTSSRLTGNRWVSGYLSGTSRSSLVFDTLGNFEVHALGTFGAFDPAYTGMRIVLNSGGSYMGMDWQTSAGRGALNVSPGSAAISAQQGVTDNRLTLSVDGNKLLLTNPTTSGTNQLFQIDRTGGIVTLYGYPNTTGKLLSTDVTGTVVQVDPPAFSTPDLQAVLTQGNFANNGMTLLSSGGTGSITMVPLDFSNSLFVGSATPENALPSSVVARGSSGVVGVARSNESSNNSDLMIDATTTGLRLNYSGSSTKSSFIQYGYGDLQFKAGITGSTVATLFSDGRLSGAAAQNTNEFVTLSQLKYQSIRSITASTTVTSTDRTIINQATSDNPIITLPTDPTETGRVITIVEGAADPATNGCSWTPSVRVDGSTTANDFTTLSAVRRLTVQYDGSEWWVISF